MSSVSGATPSGEDVSWHQPECIYKKFVENHKEGCLLTDDDARLELGKKYKRDTQLARVSGSTKRRKQKREVDKGLTSAEETSIQEKVGQAMDPHGAIRWYLDSQRKEMEETKARLKQECECVKENDNMSPPKQIVEEVAVAAVVSAQLNVDVEAPATLDEKAPATIDEEDDDWMRF